MTVTAPSLPQRALFKMRVYFTHATPGTAGQCDFYSFDTSGRFRVADPAAYGLRQLKQMADKMGGRISRAIIYDNQAAGKPEYTRLEKGIWSR